jgi:outer membrane protease
MNRARPPLIAKIENAYAHTVRNIAVFPSLVIISAALFFAALFFPLPLQGQTPQAKDFPYAVSVSPLSGFLYGQGEELVYKGENSSTYWSELLWDIKPVFYAGALLDIARKEQWEKPGPFFSLSMKFAFPMRTGIMEDRDWDAPNNMLSNYSRHDSKAEEAWFHDFSAGVSLPVRSRALFRGYLGLSYTHFKWTSSDGYLKYAKKAPDKTYLPLEDSDPEIPLSGQVVSYTQEWVTLFCGFSVLYVFHPRFSAGISIRLSPLLYFTGEDIHHRTNSQYNDYIFGGLYVEPGGELVFTVNKWFSTGLQVSWRYIKGNANGDTYSRNTRTNESRVFQGNLAGAAYQALDLGLVATIHL